MVPAQQLIHIAAGRDNTHSFIKGWRGKSCHKEKKCRGCFAFTFRVLHKPHAYQHDWRCHGKVIGIITLRGRLPFIRAHSGILAKQLLFKLRMLGGLQQTGLSAAAAAHVQPPSAYYPVDATARYCFYYRFSMCPDNS